MDIIAENDVEKVFTGNSDSSTYVANLLPTPMYCRFMRILPQSWYGHMSMRFDFVGGDCDLFLQ